MKAKATDWSTLRLIAFINDDEEHRAGHWWGKKSFGVIDFAFTHISGDANSHHSELEGRLGAVKVIPRLEYDPPAAGARLRPDGQEVKWEITFPSANFLRGELPFFCHDVSDRSLRLPQAAKNVEHPCGAYGLESMSVYVSESKIEALKQGYATLLNVPTPSAGAFEVQRYAPVEGVKPAEIRLGKPTEDWQLDGRQSRDGVFIGDMVFGCHGRGTDGGGAKKVRIDPRDEGLGGICLSWEA